MLAPQPFRSTPSVSVTAYAVEQRVQKAYRHLLFHELETLFHLPAPDALTYLIETAFASYFAKKATGKRKRGDSQKYWQAEERLQYDIPELMARLPLAELEHLLALLQEKKLIEVVTLVWYTYRPLLRTFDNTPME